MSTFLEDVAGAVLPLLQSSKVKIFLIKLSLDGSDSVLEDSNPNGYRMRAGTKYVEELLDVPVRIDASKSDLCAMIYYSTPMSNYNTKVVSRSKAG